MGPPLHSHLEHLKRFYMTATKMIREKVTDRTKLDGGLEEKGQGKTLSELFSKRYKKQPNPNKQSNTTTKTHQKNPAQQTNTKRNQPDPSCKKEVDS